MFKNIKLAVVIIVASVFLLGAIGSLAYFQIKKIKNQTIDSVSATQAKLDAQQGKIDELQSYKDEQIREAEEEKRIAEQREQENAIASKLANEQKVKQNCEDTKRYCSEEIKSRKISIDDIAKTVKEDQSDVEDQEDRCKKAKADEGNTEMQIKIACVETLSESRLKEEEQNLATQEKELADLLKGKCLNYKELCN